MTVVLDNLNDDVLSSIILEVHDSSRNSVFSLLRVNRSLNKAAVPFVLRKLTLYFDDKWVAATNDRISGWCQDAIAMKSIRFITVVSASSAWTRFSFGGADTADVLSAAEESYARLAELVVGLKGLKDFTFACHHPIPSSLLDTLHTHQPTVRLHIKNWTRKSYSTPFGDPLELKLAESPILCSIHAETRTGGPGMDLHYPALLRILTLAPNLESYHYEAKPMGGCVRYGFTEEQMRETHRQAALFKVENPKKKAFKSVHLGAYLPSDPDLLNAYPFVDWSKVSTLTGVTIGHPFHSLDGSLFASLKCLSVQFGWSSSENPAYDTFFASLNPLESLTIVGGLEFLSLSMLLAHHGDSLRTLRFHEIETAQEESRRKTLIPAEVDTIRHSCPQLRELTFDVDRTESREHEASIYELLRQMPELRKLTIHLDLGLPFLNDPWDTGNAEKSAKIYPALQRNDLEAIWEAVGGRQSTKLQRLTVLVGEQNRFVGGYPAHWVMQEQDLRQMLVAERSERDDRKHEVILSGFPEKISNRGYHLVFDTSAPLPGSDDEL